MMTDEQFDGFVSALRREQASLQSHLDHLKKVGATARLSDVGNDIASIERTIEVVTERRKGTYAQGG